MTLQTALLVVASAALGVVVSSWYGFLTRVSMSPLVESMTATSRRRHALYELGLTVVAVPLLVLPFAALIALPVKVATVLDVKSAFWVVLAPIISLVSLGVAHRVSARRSEEPGV